jgi:hypothetical protein
VLEQYTYEPYGALVAAELYYPHAMNRAGHQGLFFERFDGAYDDYTLFRVIQGTAFITGAKGLYYNRNRFYLPSLGRFTTRDPNETALPILRALASNATIFDIVASAFDARALYGDGMNLYSRAGSNSVNRVDPSGNEWSLGGTVAAVGTAAYMAWNLYDMAQGAYNVFQMFRNNASWDQVLLAAAIEAAFNLGPGNEFAHAYDALKFFKRTVFRGIGKSVRSGLRGQLHHAISKKVHDELERHPLLRGKFKYRDKRFASRAIDEDAHKGYQTWHRNHDEEIAEWIKRKRDATPEQFEAKLREYYGSDDLKRRFPMGLGPEDMFK